MRKFCMVRAFGSEPVKLLLGSRFRRHIEVFSLTCSASIRMPGVDVFVFDEALFGELKQAHERGDVTALADLWRRATPAAPPDAEAEQRERQ